MKAIKLIGYCRTARELEELKAGEVAKFKKGQITKDELQPFLKAAYAHKDYL